MKDRPRPAAASASPRERARVFWTGRSQAVRLPKEFRFEGGEVAIHREGDRVVLEPVKIERDAKGWPLAVWALAGAAPAFDVGNRRVPHEREDVLEPAD
jgi:virulence-associated protein VagC